MKKQIKYLLLLLFCFLYQSTLYSQTDSLKRHGIGIGINFYNHADIYVSYSKILNWPKYGDEISQGFEISKIHNKTRLILSNRVLFNLFKTKNDFKIGVGISGLFIPNFLYTKTDTIVNFGLRPGLFIGYKNLSIGYQYAFFSFKENIIGLDRQTIFVYYRLGL